ncbi:MAG TPA: folylpolyglutamate synthase/dihydrofolate synthase family protein [Gemmatimonadaceae bacterium]|nr:folylpolyglutamate synthase/dihydrofolate synthase family protein [Gemmatimonadaceae bacterium]
MGVGLSGYREALDYLFVRTTGQWKFGLERTVALLDALGNPHRALRVVHVGGTNGKGSVCATLDTVLRARGFRVARYTSPHLVDFRERMLVDGAPVSEDAIVDFVERWTPTIERLGATFFEATTAMAFDLFASAEPDVAIIEVGLGGRLDATNVVDPTMAVVTSIGIDHTEYLGDTVDEIAAEKAGIFKSARPAVIGERDARIRALLTHRARAVRAAPVHAVFDDDAVRDVRVTAAGTSFAIVPCDDGVAGNPTSITCTTALYGRHQAYNASVGLAALAKLPAPYATPMRVAQKSLPSVRLPGRFDVHDRFVLDVAHNRDGAAVCADTLESFAPPRPWTVLLSVLADKDWRGIITELGRVVDEFVLTTAPTSPESRRWSSRMAADYAEQHGLKALVIDDFDRALAHASGVGGTVIVTGSFHTVGDAMTRLQISPFAR